ncbi:uncharacterized protein B0H64DRAFT_384606 [Chaetomium fimeti]|uniref:Uncharacterized protein n=1 Tax=Chaetomium fimeti TaxID=1854472 RepID=A0AAE0HMB8_9PEZI|nr:hypothetical protein B0H64DRAFT_384606 [Chaetomium fimeti]
MVRGVWWRWRRSMSFSLARPLCISGLFPVCSSLVLLLRWWCRNGRGAGLAEGGTAYWVEGSELAAVVVRNGALVPGSSLGGWDGCNEACE